VWNATAVSFRNDVERRSAVVLVFLSKLPRALPGLVVIGAVAAALLAPPVVGGVLLLFVAAVLGWLAYLSWPRLPGQARAIRLAVFALVLGYALSRLVSD